MIQKINKYALLRSAAKKTNVKIGVVNKVYDAIIDEIEQSVCEGKSVVLTKFGTFVLKEHKGHPVQRRVVRRTKGKNKENIISEEPAYIADYIVLKFEVSNSLIKRIRSKCGRSSVCSEYRK